MIIEPCSSYSSFLIKFSEKLLIEPKILAPNQLVYVLYSLSCFVTLTIVELLT